MRNDGANGSVELGRGSRLYIASVEGVGDAVAAAGRLAEFHPRRRLVGVVSSDLDDHLWPVLTALSPAVAELIFFDALTPPQRPGVECWWPARRTSSRPRGSTAPARGGSHG